MPFVDNSTANIRCSHWGNLDLFDIPATHEYSLTFEPGSEAHDTVVRCCQRAKPEDEWLCSTETLTLHQLPEIDVSMGLLVGAVLLLALWGWRQMG